MKIKEFVRYVRNAADEAKKDGGWASLIAELWGVLSTVAEGEISAGRGWEIVEAVRAFYEANKDKVDDLFRRAKEQAGEAVESVGGDHKWGGRNAALKCRLASCWDGDNAEKRMMNMLSPSMSENNFDSYLSWMKGRGVDCAHLLLMNKADGENAGYSVYGTGGTGEVRKDVVEVWGKRLQKIKKAGLSVGLWLVADDSNDWANAMLKNAAGYVADLKNAGILQYADLCVLGLEMDEYGSSVGWNALAAAVRGAAPGLYIATHHKPGKYTYAKLGEGVMGQTEKDASKATIAKMVEKIKGMGKDCWAFELARHPDKTRCEQAFAKGAVGVGNW